MRTTHTYTRAREDITLYYDIPMHGEQEIRKRKDTASSFLRARASRIDARRVRAFEVDRARDTLTFTSIVLWREIQISCDTFFSGPRWESFFSVIIGGKSVVAR